MLYQTQIKRHLSFDIAVCGGGFSGFASAYAAAKQGARVILIERNGCLGGVGTQGLVNHILGVRAIVGEGYKACVGGVFSEIEKRLISDKNAIDVQNIDLNLCPHGWKRSLGIGMIFNNEAMKLLLEQKLLEAGVEILYFTDIVDVVESDSKISAVIAHNKSGFCAIHANCFVDATGDGDICAMAGNETILGDENGEMAAASLEMHVENVDSKELKDYMERTNDVRFKDIIKKLKADGVWNFPYEIFISVMLTQDDVFMINTIRQVGINGIDANSISQGVLQGRKQSYDLLEIMRKHFPGFKNATIRQIAPNIGIRETRRLKSEYVLKVSDLVQGVTFEDSIAVSGYGWDMPNPKAPSHQPFEKVTRKSPFTEIPYRSLLPLKTENLIAVGRCIGVEREVLGCVRVMGPCIAMGEAAGIAAAMASNTDHNFKNVNINILKEKIALHGGITDIEQIPN